MCELVLALADLAGGRSVWQRGVSSSANLCAGNKKSNYLCRVPSLTANPSNCVSTFYPTTGNCFAKLIDNQDIAAPLLPQPERVITAQCGAVPAAATLAAIDECDASPMISIAEQTVNGTCPQNYTLFRTWTATDACGNSASVSQTVVVVVSPSPI